jgi:hypothetical protein
LVGVAVDRKAVYTRQAHRKRENPRRLLTAGGADEQGIEAAGAHEPPDRIDVVAHDGDVFEPAPQTDGITVNWPVEPGDSLGPVRIAAGRTEQTVLDITPVGLAPVRALLTRVGHPAATPDAAKAPVR